MNSLFVTLAREMNKHVVAEIGLYDMHTANLLFPYIFNGVIIWK